MYGHVNWKLLEQQKKFRIYYNENLGDKFVALEQKRKEYLGVFWVRLLYWLLFNVCVLVDSVQDIYVCGITYLLLATIPFLLAENYFRKNSPLMFVIGIAVLLLVYYTMAPFSERKLSTLDQNGIKGVFNTVFIFYSLVFYHIYEPALDYKHDTKTMVQQKIIDFFGKFTYMFAQTMPAAILNQSQLFSSFNQQEGDDYFFGTYQNVDITVSEEKLIRKGDKKSTTVFRGIIIKLAMNKNFSGQTVVFENSCFSRWRTKKILEDGVKKKMQKINLEDSRFNNMFDVYASDQVEARYLLTTALMEKILRLKKMYHGRKIELSFFDNEVLIAIPSRKDMFETTSLFYTTARYGKMSEVVRQFHYILEIIEILQLNKKILL